MLRNPTKVAIVISVLAWSVTTLLAQAVSEISVTEARKMIQKGDVTVLDVRTLDEWKQGFIESARHIDVLDKSFKQKVSALDKSKPVIVYCAVGGRSAYAADDMAKLGFKNVYNLTGGIRAWTAAGYPVKK